MKISELIKLLETRKKQFGNIDVVDDLGYITNDIIYNEEDNSLMIVTDTFRKVRRNGKEKIKSAIKKTIRYMNGNYYSKFEEKMIVGYLVGALKELED